jgi:hypothetical protein
MKSIEKLILKLLNNEQKFSLKPFFEAYSELLWFEIKATNYEPITVKISEEIKSLINFFFKVQIVAS